MRTFPSPSPAPPTAACRRRTACGSPQLVSTPRPRWPVLTRRRMAGFEVSIEVATYQTLDDPPLPFQLQDQSRRYDADDGAVNGNSAAAAGRGAPAEPGSRPKLAGDTRRVHFGRGPQSPQRTRAHVRNSRNSFSTKRGTPVPSVR